MSTCVVANILWMCLIFTQWETVSPKLAGVWGKSTAFHCGDTRGPLPCARMLSQSVDAVSVLLFFPRGWISSVERPCCSRSRMGCTNASLCSSWMTTTQTWTSGLGGENPFTETGSMLVRPPAVPIATLWSGTFAWASCTISPRILGKSRWWQQISSTAASMRLTSRDIGSRPRPSSTRLPPSSPIGAERMTWS